MYKFTYNSYMVITLLLVGISENSFTVGKLRPWPLAIKILRRQKPACRHHFGNTVSLTFYISPVHLLLQLMVEPQWVRSYRYQQR